MSPRRTTLPASVGAAVAALAFCSVGCGDEQPNSIIANGTKPNTQDTAATPNPPAQGADGDLVSGEDDANSVDNGTSLLPEDQVCQAVAFDAAALPVDIYIMLDQSVSMEESVEGAATTRWEGVVAAIRTFVRDPRTEGIGVGLQYFGQTLKDDCDPTKYATPAVAIGELPAAADAIEASLDDAAGPSTFTPTYPALEGALMHAQQHANQNPERATVVLLATDGLPFTAGQGDCNDSVADIAKLAEAPAQAENRVRTYLVGVSDGLANLEAIAEQGTGEAFLIDRGDIKQQFVDAMLSIIESPLGCEFKLPEPDDHVTLDPQLVRVSYEDALTGKKEEIPRITKSVNCPLVGNGWFYDDEENPTTVKTCQGTCDRFAAGRVSIELGCRPAMAGPR